MDKNYNKKLVIGLFAVILFQLGVLAFEYLGTSYPLWTGTEIRLKTIPVDPRSMFRGNYARLRYDVAAVPVESINRERVPRNGEIVFVQLKKNKEGVYSYAGATLHKPTEGMFIRGRIDRHRFSSRKPAKEYRVRFGIEAFFAPKEKALQLEKMLRHNAVAVVKVAGNGKAALVNVVEQNGVVK